jgi:hypothetical protein
MITWFNAPNEGLSPGGQLTLKTLTATENKTYQEDGTAYTSVTVNVEGGGGSSDFSTATLTLVGFTNEHVTCARVLENAEYGLQGTFGDASVGADGTQIEVILYKGVAYFAVGGLGTKTPSGNITFDSDLDMFVMTGDGTITIS